MNHENNQQFYHHFDKIVDYYHEIIDHFHEIVDYYHEIYFFHYWWILASNCFHIWQFYQKIDEINFKSIKQKIDFTFSESANFNAERNQFHTTKSFVVDSTLTLSKGITNATHDSHSLFGLEICNAKHVWIWSMFLLLLSLTSSYWILEQCLQTF